MTPEQRSGIENGIWLCQNCATLIDRDASEWTVERLRATKAEAETRAHGGIGRRRESAKGALLVEAEYCQFIKQYSAAYVPVCITNESRRPVTIKRAWLRLGGVDYLPSTAIVNLTVGYDWLPPHSIRLESHDACTGALYFGWSFPNGGPAVIAAPGMKAELFVEPVGGPVILRKVRFLHPDDDGNPE